MTTVRGALTAFWDRHAGGLLPYTRFERSIPVSDGAQYDVRLTWFRRIFRFGYDTPNEPRSVRRARETDKARLSVIVRRGLTGEPLVQVGDLIPQWATAFLDRVEQVRDSDLTVWKRAVGDERYARDEDGHLDRGQEYDWVAWCAGEWGGGWTTTGGLLDSAPLSVLKTIDPPPPDNSTTEQQGSTQ